MAAHDDITMRDDHIMMTAHDDRPMECRSAAECCTALGLQDIVDPRLSVPRDNVLADVHSSEDAAPRDHVPRPDVPDVLPDASPDVEGRPGTCNDAATERCSTYECGDSRWLANITLTHQVSKGILSRAMTVHAVRAVDEPRRVGAVGRG